MSYSDYGGYGYRNGERVEERSDCSLSDNTIIECMGWVLEVQGKKIDTCGHVILGDGEYMAVLYKQSSLSIYRTGEKFPIVDLVKEKHGAPAIETYEGEEYVNVDWFKETENLLEIELPGGYKLTAAFRELENHYQFVKLEQPDGTVWTGFSGYGVGAGLEDAGYWYSTAEQVERLFQLFPVGTKSEQPIEENGN